jgi:phytoene desaturase
MHVTVIGAGLGGLATAIRLARHGYTVEIIEKNAHYGGKVCEKEVITDQGRFRWDCGPSLLTLPHVLKELFEYCDQSLENHLHLTPTQPICRYFWSDGKRIDEDETFWKQPEVAAYLNYAKGIYELSGETFLNYAPSEWWRALHPKRWSALRHFPKVATFKNLAQLHEKFFPHHHLQQLFNRFATYNGSSPYQTPATFAIIPYVEATFGGWHPKGGMARIAEALYHLACQLGVTFHFNQEIKDFSKIKSDITVYNGDIIHAHSHHSLLSHFQKQTLQSKPLACSGFIVWLAVKKNFPQLAHHNIFFSDNYRNEFHAITQEKQLPQEPTIYLSITSKTDAQDAPAGCENWFLLVNSPAYDRLPTNDYETVILQRLKKFGLELKAEDILHQESFTVHDFIKRDNAWQGSLYGWASHSVRTALFRPYLRHPKQKNLFFVGGTVHPGGGMPLALLSGKIVANKILKTYPNRKKI